VSSRPPIMRANQITIAVPRRACSVGFRCFEIGLERFVDPRHVVIELIDVGWLAAKGIRGGVVGNARTDKLPTVLRTASSKSVTALRERVAARLRLDAAGGHGISAELLQWRRSQSSNAEEREACPPPRIRKGPAESWSPFEDARERKCAGTQGMTPE
jgi:hypothetical protein